MHWVSFDLKSLTTKKVGIGRYTTNLVKALLRNHRFKYYGITGPETEFEKLKSISLDGEYHFSIGSTLIRSAFLPIILPEFIRLHHSFDNSSLFPINNKIKKISTIHDIAVFQYPEFFSKKHCFVVRQLIRNAINTADHVITSSHATRKGILHFFPKINPKKITVIHLGADQVNARRFLKDDKLLQKQKMQKRFKEIPDNYFLSLCTLEPRKNIRRLIKAFIEMRKTHKSQDFGLILAGGKGWLESGLGNNEEDLKQKNIYTLGFVEDEWLPYLYSNAIAFIYPSIHEGFGLPPLEAMSYKTPVIISETSSLPEVGGNAALYINPFSIESIKKAIEKIGSDITFRQETSEKCFQQSQLFSWKKTAEETERVYRYVLGN